MLHGIIIDDEYNGVRTLELLISKFVPELKIVATTTDPVEGIDLINSYRPDIVFLDINMPLLNGFELLDRLTFNKFSLVFTTAHQEYAVKAIKRAASDYLLKPIDALELKNTVERIGEKRGIQPFEGNIQKILAEIIGLKNTKIPVPSRNTVEYVLPSSIIYIEAESNSCKMFLSNLSLIDVNKSLKDYEQLLCREGLFFLRIHNSYIINLNYVMRYLKENGGQVVMQGNKQIPLSKHKKEFFLQFFNLQE